jgi:hypothetical protein
MVRLKYDCLNARENDHDTKGYNSAMSRGRSGLRLRHALSLRNSEGKAIDSRLLQREALLIGGNS